MARTLPSPSVEPRPDSIPFQSAGVSPAAFGADIARGAEQLGGALLEIGRNEAQKANAFAAADLDMQYAKEVSDLLYHPGGGVDETGQPRKPGYMFRQGSDAVDNKKTLESLEKIYKKYEGQAQNEEQRKAYVLRARARTETWYNTINQHAGVERRKWYENVATGVAKLTSDEVARNYADPTEVEKQLDKARPILILQWAEHLPPEEIQARWQAFEAETLAAAVEGYIGAHRSTDGLKYFESVKSRLGVRAAGLEQKLKVAADRDENERLSTEAWERVSVEATDGATGRFNPELARTALVELYPPEVRSRIETEVEKEIGQATRDQGVDDDQKISRLTVGILRSNRLDRNSPDYTTLDDVGRSKAESAAELRNRILANSAAGNRLVKTVNRIALNKFNSIQDPAVQADMTDEQLLALGPADEEGFTGLQAARTKAQKVVQRGQTITLGAFNQRVAKVVPVLRKNFGEKAATDFGLLMDAWWHEQAKDGKDPSETEVIKMLGERLLQLDYTWPSDNKPSFMANEKERASKEQGGLPRLPIEDQIFEEAKALLRQQETDKNDPFAEKRKLLRSGEVLIMREGVVGKIKQSDVRPTDKVL